jgi:hypothetical protein
VRHFRLERAGRKGAEKLGFGPGQVEPGAPVLTLEHDNLAVMIRRNILSGFRRQHGKAGCAVDGVLPDEAGNTEPIHIGEGKVPFILALCLVSGVKQAMCVWLPSLRYHA